MSGGTHRVKESEFALAYSAPNFILLSGSTVSTRSSTGSSQIDVSSFKTNNVCAYINPVQDASGSITVSGSPDGTNFYNIYSLTFNSGSFTGSNIGDSYSKVSVYLTNLVQDSSITGSLWLVCKT